MTMNLNKLKEEVVQGFRNNKGKCGVRLYPPINPADIICEIISRYFAANPDKKVFIAVDCYATRKDIIKCLKENKISQDNIKILSLDYINHKYKYHTDLMITVGINDNVSDIYYLMRYCTFMFCVITKNNLNTEFNIEVGKLFPFITTTVTAEQVRTDNVYSPVEETLLGVELSYDDRIEYDKQSDYITTSLTIFGDFYNIDKCKRGDVKLGISASEIRESIARDNGWSDTLDTSIELNRQIDAIYNPNVLFERANTVYNIIKQRRDLITDNVVKLEVIKNIILDNPNSKILVLSKRGEYAALITKYLNDNNIKCGDYHDAIENTIAIDDAGFPILVKSGVNKGKPRVIGAQAISTNNLKKFNDGTLDVLSIKNASNNKLQCEVDILIITSPMCEEIYDIKQRFLYVQFNSVPNIVYNIFCINTSEHDRVDKKKNTSIHTIINNCENNQKMTDDFEGIIL